MDQLFYVKDIYSMDQCSLFNGTLKSILLLSWNVYFLTLLRLKKHVETDVFSELCTILYQNI